MALLLETLTLGAKSSFFSLAKIALVLFPLFIFIELAKELGWLERVTKSLAGVLRRLYLPEQAALPLAAGLIIGFTYGAGVILKAVKEAGWTRRELTLLWFFLSLSHAVIEDTAIFAALGIPVAAVLAVRVVPTICATWALSLWFQAQEGRGSRAL